MEINRIFKNGRKRKIIINIRGKYTQRAKTS